MFARPTFTGSTASTLKSHNLRAILFTLLHEAPVSRVQIAQLTGLSTTTVTNLIAGLLSQGIVCEEASISQAVQRGVGRPRTALRLEPRSRYAVGIFIGVDHVRVALTDLFARPVASEMFDHLARDPAHVLDEAAALAGALIERAGISPAAVVGVGVGASGLVEPHTGVNVLAPNLGWHDVPIRDWLADRLGRPVFVDNNVRAMALSEALFGAAQDAGVLAYVYARVGVGAGFVVGGQLYRGGAGAGEIGHMTLLAEGGEACHCGNVGCLETLVSERAFLRAAYAAARQEPDGALARALRTGDGPPIERLFEVARAGDATAQAVLDGRACYMGIALANLVNTFSPELIILGGIFAQGADVLLPAVARTLRERAFANLGEAVRLQPPTFGPEAGIVGAAALALDAFFYDQPEGIIP